MNLFWRLPCGEGLSKKKGSETVNGGPGDGGDWERERLVILYPSLKGQQYCAAVLEKR